MYQEKGDSSTGGEGPRTTSPHDPTNRLISNDRNNYPQVQISRIDGQTLGILGPVKVNLRSENGPFGPPRRVFMEKGFQFQTFCQRRSPHECFTITNKDHAVQ